MIRLSISVQDAAMARLKEISVSSGCSVANVIRMLLWERLEDIYGKGGQGEVRKAVEGGEESVSMRPGIGSYEGCAISTEEVNGGKR